MGDTLSACAAAADDCAPVNWTAPAISVPRPAAAVPLAAVALTDVLSDAKPTFATDPSEGY